MDSRTYFKLDDHLPENPKIIAAGEDAELLYIHGLAYCSRQLTNGVIPKAIVPRLVAKGAEKRSQALVANELWIDRGDSFEVHDYLLHQRSREQIENERRKARERAAKSRRMSGVTSSEVQQPEAEALSEALSEAGKPLAPKTARKPDLLFDAVTEACGINPSELTDSSRGALNKSLAMLRGVDAEPAEVHRRAGNWPSVFPEATLTPPALAKHWPQLEHPRSNGRRDRFVEMGRSLQDRVARMGGDDEQAGAVGDQARRGLPQG